LFKQLEAFAKKHGLRFVEELDLARLGQFRSEWKDGPRSSLKKLERLRAFLRFCECREWIKKNPASELKAPKVHDRPTLPYSQAEMVKILAAFAEYEKGAGIANAQRLRAFVLVLRYSGMRIGDTVKLSVHRISSNKLFLYTQKTGVAVNCVLPDFVIRELEKAPKSSEGHFFWTGKSKLHSAIGKWQRRLQRLFGFAGIERGHAHRFRDTFACELLLSGVPMERVSILLGHSSIKITEKHYNPWVRSRQDQLEADLERAWSQDPVALMEAGRDFVGPLKGTKKVHEKGERIN
jgi:integrase